MQLTDGLFDYIENHIDAEPEGLHRLMRRSNLRMVHGRMCSGHHQGRLLKMLVRLSGAKKVLELGAFTGYATLCLAEGVAENLRDNPATSSEGEVDARVDTIEIFDENEDFLREAFSDSEYGRLIRLIIGDALEVMPRLVENTYDLIFMDADKRYYPEFYREAKRLLRKGGLIIADNTLWDGHVIESGRHDPQTLGIERFNNEVASDSEVEKVIIPLRDGLTLIRKR